MSQGFVDHCLELLAPLGRVRARRMFGGHGLYADDLFVALIAGERLYVKVDADAEAHFTAAGCAPFVYEGQARPVKMSYWTVPDEAMESPSLMLPWARLAMQAALKAATAKAGRTTYKAKGPGTVKARTAKAASAANPAKAAATPPSKPAATQRKAPPGAAPRAPKARPPRPRRCRPAAPGVRRRRANGRRPGRPRASA